MKRIFGPELLTSLVDFWQLAMKSEQNIAVQKNFNTLIIKSFTNRYFVKLFKEPGQCIGIIENIHDFLLMKTEYRGIN